MDCTDSTGDSPHPDGFYDQIRRAAAKRAGAGGAGHDRVYARLPQCGCTAGAGGLSHLWLLWHFSEVRQTGWSPTVRPPRLGGNTRMGVFATRSPYRPNPIGLSSVRLEGIDPDTPQGPVIRVSGADLMDGTPILDIKPYLPYTDSHPQASVGLSQRAVGAHRAGGLPPCAAGTAAAGHPPRAAAVPGA